MGGADLRSDAEVQQQLIRCCAEIVSEMIAGIQAGKDVNLNGLRSRISRKLKLKAQPKLVDIIAAIPQQHKALLLPRLRAKPVRTASGVCFILYRMYSSFQID